MCVHRPAKSGYKQGMHACGRKYQNADESCQPARAGWVDRLVGQFAPWRCILCSQAAVGMDLCIGCLHDLPWAGAACRRCALPLTRMGVCGRCNAAPPPMAQALVAFAYEFPLPQLISRLKYGRQPLYARVLGELLAIRLLEAVHAAELRLPDLLVPVPLHRWRHWRRGFNQAELIAVHAGRDLRLPVLPAAVKRLRATPTQTRLSRTARQANLRGAFAAADLAGQRVAIVDDVITTGATVRELARTLRNAGASEIQVWAVARA